MVCCIALTCLVRCHDTALEPNIQQISCSCIRWSRVKNNFHIYNIYKLSKLPWYALPRVSMSNPLEEIEN